MEIGKTKPNGNRIEIFLKLVDSNYDEKQSGLIKDAFKFAVEMHEGQKRLTGEPYIIHPVSVAWILLDLGLDHETIAASLLHDVVEDTPTSLEDLENRFGKNIANLVDGVTKLDKLDFFSKEERQAESMRKMLLAMAKDVRVILIKLSDRLHNMRTLDSMSDEGKLRISKETLDIYAPIAHRLGIYSIRSELENLCLMYLDPEDYEKVSKEVLRVMPQARQFLDTQMKELQRVMDMAKIECTIAGREKHIYSVYKKMLRQKISIEEIYDIVAMRIIVNTLSDCYAALGQVHSQYKPIPGRFKDFIAMPKPNFYQSLHTTVINNQGQLFEVQIRTKEMHQIAEYGVAAHWKYKEGSTDSALDQKMAWLRQLQEIDTQDAHDFIDTVRADIFSDEVFVFTPKGEVINLVKGATPIDFAYRIHSKVGDQCVGAKVNGRIVQLDTQLETGDVTEILTRKDGRPSRDWLNIAKTNAAKSRIRAYYKRLLKGENIAKGRDSLEKEAKRAGFDLHKDLMKPEWLNIVYKRYTLNNEEDLYSTIGYGGVSAGQILQRLIDEYHKAKTPVVEEAAETPTPKKEVPQKSSHGIIVKGQANMLVRLAHCCNPVPGDDIVGFITRGRGVSVHRSDCLNLSDLLKQDEDRLIEVSWAGIEPEGYHANIEIIAVDKPGIFSELSRIPSNMGLYIFNVEAKSIPRNNTCIIRFVLEIKNIGQLESVIKQIRHSPDVIEVHRGAR